MGRHLQVGTGYPIILLQDLLRKNKEVESRTNSIYLGLVIVSTVGNLVPYHMVHRDIKQISGV